MCSRFGRFGFLQDKERDPHSPRGYFDVLDSGGKVWRGRHGRCMTVLYCNRIRLKALALTFMAMVILSWATPQVNDHACAMQAVSFSNNGLSYRMNLMYYVGRSGN